MSNINICDDETCKVDLESHEEGVIFVHCEVRNKSKSNLKKLKWIFESIKEDAYFAGLNEVFAYTMNKRFAKFIDPNFKSIGEVGDGYRKREVLAWDLIQ